LKLSSSPSASLIPLPAQGLVDQLIAEGEPYSRAGYATQLRQLYGRCVLSTLPYSHKPHVCVQGCAC
jgi:hypothetical protein